MNDSSILDSVIHFAFTALMQSVFICVVALMIAVVARRSPTLCRAVLQWALIGCIVCPVITTVLQAYGLRSMFSIDLPSINLSATAQSDRSESSSTANDLENADDELLNQTKDLQSKQFEDEDAYASDVTATSDSTLSKSSGASVASEPDNRSVAVVSDSKLPSDLPKKSGQSTVQPTNSYSEIVGTSILSIWLAGISLYVVRGISRWRRLRRLQATMTIVVDESILAIMQGIARRFEVRRLPQLLYSSQSIPPFVTGFFRPQMIVPHFMLQADHTQILQDVMAHEMGHLHSHDLWFARLQRLVQIGYWINPAIHFVSAELNRVREEICDNHVLYLTTPAGYSKTLLQVAQRIASQASQVQVPATLSVFGSQGSLEHRIADILSPGRARDIKLAAPLQKLLYVALPFGILIACQLAVTGGAWGQEEPSAKVDQISTPDDSAVAGAGIELEQAAVLLDQVLKRAAYWTGQRSESLRSLTYDYEQDKATQNIQLASGISDVPRSYWEAATLSGGIHWLARNPSAFTLATETLRDGDPNTVRIRIKRKDSADPSIRIAYGNGIDGKWMGYFSASVNEIVLDIDKTAMVPVREELGAYTIIYDDWQSVDDQHSVPGHINVAEGGQPWFDMHFQWAGNAVWLLSHADTVTGNTRTEIIRTHNVRVNDELVLKQITEREQMRHSATDPLRAMYAHNRLWLQPRLENINSLCYTFHSLREDVKEQCYFNAEGFTAFEVTHDGQNKYQGTGKRLVALPNGHWATGNRSHEYLYLKQPSNNNHFSDYSSQLRRYGSIGCQLDLPIFGLPKVLDKLTATTSQSSWNDHPCDVVLLNGGARAFKLGAGTMLAFSSWSYVHDIYPESLTIYIDRERHIPIHESVQGTRDRDFEIDYNDWQEIEPGQWIPLSIRIESKNYFTCEYQFQWTSQRHWLLKELTSWFEPSNKSRAVIEDIQFDQASELWDSANDQLEKTQKLFDDQATPSTSLLQSRSLQTSAIEFGRWTLLNELRVMPTLASDGTVILRLETDKQPSSVSTPVILFDQQGMPLECLTATLNRNNTVWEASVPISILQLGRLAEIFVPGVAGKTDRSVRVIPIDVGTAQAINIADVQNGQTRAALLNVKALESTFEVEIRVVSTDGPKGFPVYVDIMLLDESGSVVACGHTNENFVVKDTPESHDLLIPLSALPNSKQPRYTSVSVRSGPATSGPIGSVWGSYYDSGRVEISTDKLLAADDPTCHSFAIQRINEELNRESIIKEFFRDVRHRESLKERKLTRSDILGPIIPQLEAIAKKSAERSNQRDAIRLIGYSGQRQYADALLPFLSDSSEEIADATAIALAMLGRDDGIARMIKILQSPDMDSPETRSVSMLQYRMKRDVVIALSLLNSPAAIDVMGDTLLKDLHAMQIYNDEKGQPKVRGKTERDEDIFAVLRYLDTPVVAWLAKIDDYFQTNQQLLEYFDQEKLIDAMLAHEGLCRETIAQRVRHAEFWYVRAIKESRNPYYLPAFQEMMARTDIEPRTFEKGIEYLWNTGSPESIDFLKKLYDAKRQLDVSTRMKLCEALAYFGDDRGLPDALQVIRDSFVEPENISDEKARKKALRVLEDQREAGEDVFQRASSESISTAVSSSIETADPKMQRALMHVLRVSRNFLQANSSLPKPIEEAVRRWADSDDPRVQAQARELLSSRGILIIDSRD